MFKKSGFEFGSGRDALEKYMRCFAKAVSGQKIDHTVTGGFDSCLVLAYMIHSGLDPVLNVADSFSHPDVVITKRLAELRPRVALVFGRAGSRRLT